MGSLQTAPRRATDMGAGRLGFDMVTKFSTAFLIAGCAGTLLAAACSTPTAPSGQSMDRAPAPPVSSAEAPPVTARYRVTFQATWSRTTHPVDFPANPHLSPLVGGTHDGSMRFWTEGVPATAGIKNMAETGSTSPLDQEIGAAVAAGGAEQVLLGGNIPNSPGSVGLEFQVSRTHPLVTLVSMIAPSPDWFVGVSALALFEDGQWVSERQIDLVPWDAGTDSGSTFTSPDQGTMPPQPISRIVTSPLSPSGSVSPVGTFTFTRLPD